VFFVQPFLTVQPQAKGDIRVFGRIFCGPVKRDAIKRNLLFARAADIFEGDR